MNVEINHRISLIYYDPNNESNDLKIKLEEIYEDIIYPTNLESIITFIQSIKNEEKIFFITLYSNMTEILSHIEIFCRINGIFIFCSNNDKHKYIFEENLNIIGNFHDINFLCSSIDKEIDSINQQYYRWTFF